MDALRELYIACSELKEAEEALKKADHLFFEYINLNVSREEKTAFYETINEIMRIREEYFFKAGFKTAVKMMFH